MFEEELRDFQRVDVYSHCETGQKDYAWNTCVPFNEWSAIAEQSTFVFGVDTHQNSTTRRF